MICMNCVQNKFVIVFCLVCFLFIRCRNTQACLSITDDLNSPNPVLNADFKIQPDVSPFVDCWAGTLRIRSSNNNWRLIANRIGPSPITITGDSKHDIKASDLSLELQLKAFGMTGDDGAILVSPFSTQTDLSSIESGTFVVAGLEKSSNSCSSRNQNFYKVTQNLCLFRDFIFNVGEYSGEVSYTLIAP